LSDSSIYLNRSISHDGRIDSNTKRSDDSDATSQHFRSDYNRAYDPGSFSNMIQTVTAPISKATQRATMARAATATAAFFPLPLALLARFFPSDLSSDAVTSSAQRSAQTAAVVHASIFFVLNTHSLSSSSGTIPPGPGYHFDPLSGGTVHSFTFHLSLMFSVGVSANSGARFAANNLTEKLSWK